MLIPFMLDQNSSKFILPSECPFTLISLGINVFVKESLSPTFWFFSVSGIFFDIGFQICVPHGLAVFSTIKSWIKIEHSTFRNDQIVRWIHAQPIVSISPKFGCSGFPACRLDLFQSATSSIVPQYIGYVRSGERSSKKAAWALARDYPPKGVVR